MWSVFTALCCSLTQSAPPAIYTVSLIIILGGKSNKKDNTVIKGDSGTKSLVVYFSQADVVDLDKTDAVSSASMRTDKSGAGWISLDYTTRA